MITRKQDVYDGCGGGQLKENMKLIKIGSFFPSEKKLLLLHTAVRTCVSRLQQSLLSESESS